MSAQFVPILSRTMKSILVSCSHVVKKQIIVNVNNCYYATLSPILVFNIFLTAQAVTWHNILIQQLTLRFKKLLNSASPRSITQ